MWSAEGTGRAIHLQAQTGCTMDGAFRAKISPHSLPCEIWRVCSAPLLALPELGNSETWPKESGGATAPPFQMPVCLQFGTERGANRARAWRIENSPARGPRHENAF
jgi:hypothetical protein